MIPQPMASRENEDEFCTSTTIVNWRRILKSEDGRGPTGSTNPVKPPTATGDLASPHPLFLRHHVSTSQQSPALNPGPVFASPCLTPPLVSSTPDWGVSPLTVFRLRLESLVGGGAGPRFGNAEAEHVDRKLSPTSAVLLRRIMTILELWQKAEYEAETTESAMR
jgi:hypothetical protein